MATIKVLKVIKSPVISYALLAEAENDDLLLGLLLGPGDVSHRHVSAQLCQGGRAEGGHAVRGASQSSHRRRIRTL